jgi:diguanylate cyclase (GGDEF)-like protein
LLKSLFSTIGSFFANEYLQISKVVVILVVATLSTAAYMGGLFNPFENVTLDYRFKARPVQPTDPRVMIIQVAEDSIDSIGRWPWKREWHATMVKALKDFGASAVAFDVLFSETSTDESDTLLTKYVEQAGNVFLPVAFAETHGIIGQEMVRSIEPLQEAARGEGHISITPDNDGILRRIKLRHRHEGKNYLQLGFRLALDAYGVHPDDLVIKKDRIEVPLPEADSFSIPLTEEGDLIINWAGEWGEGFEHMSFIDVIVSYTQWLKGQPTRIDVTKFQDAICVIGVTAMGLFDIRSIPLEPAYPAVGINATILNSVLLQRFFTVLDQRANLIILWVLALLIFVITLRLNYLPSTLIIVAMALLYTGAAIGLFIWSNIIVAMVAPIFLIFASYLIMTAYHQIVVTIEKRRLLSLATKDSMTGLFNIGHFKLLLGAEIKSVKLRRNKMLSIIMVDADHFKMVNDTFGHQSGDEVLRFIAETLKVTSRSLDVPCRYGGEEFILMLPGADTENAKKVAEKIRTTLQAKKFYLGEKKTLHPVTLSLGVSTYNGSELGEEFIKRADKALYEAKETGRNKVVCAPS